MNKITVIHEYGYRTRTAHVKLNGHRRVRISQMVSRYGQDVEKLKTPSISYSMVSPEDADDIRVFIKALQKGLRIFDKWNADAGKHYLEIKELKEWMECYEAHRPK